jgi:hypothetical protein
MVQPSETLKDFHQRHCPNVPVDSPIIIFKLLEEIVKKEKEKKENEKQD